MRWGLRFDDLRSTYTESTRLQGVGGVQGFFGGAGGSVALLIEGV